jgi:hypothetical protein
MRAVLGSFDKKQEEDAILVPSFVMMIFGFTRQRWHIVLGGSKGARNTKL